MTLVLNLIGVLVFVGGLLFSIAWHELGHLSTAKLFGIRVPQYMVGFGKTIWSRRKGETEYGIKAIPMGGYIRMIGMFPPGEDGKVTARSTSPFRSMIEDARSAAYEELQPGDESRLFYTRKPWKRVIVMFAGPFMNLVLALAIFFGVWMTFGINRTTTQIASVSPCVIQQSENREVCKAGDPVAPAKQAGLRADDRIVGFGGRPVADWSEVHNRYRDTYRATNLNQSLIHV
ncbi:M50 family metallopeptidase, partial [Streptomyces lavendulae]|uniref:M50 family metallopeptidase n=1 Tax=Streptomyces lavendulae TaxID=1914 RepID=UPI00367F1748